MRLNRSKRGDVTDVIADFLPYLLFALIIIAFLIIFNLKGDQIENSFRIKIQDVTGGYESTNFLRSQVKIDFDGTEQYVDMANLIIYNYPDLEYEDAINKNLTKFFDDWKGKGWDATIKYPNGAYRLYGHTPTKSFIVKSLQAGMLAIISNGRIIKIPTAKITRVNTYLPLPNGEVIEVKYAHWVIVLG